MRYDRIAATHVLSSGRTEVAYFALLSIQIKMSRQFFFEIGYAYYDHGRLLEVAVIADPTLVKDEEAAKRWARALSTALIPVATGKESVLTIPPFKFP